MTFDTQSIHLEGVANARELGGIALPGGKIRHGLLLRGSALGRATYDDIRALSERFGVRRIYDLRMREEIAAEPDREVPGADNRWVPILSEDAARQVQGLFFNGIYRDMDDMLIRGSGEESLQEYARDFYVSMLSDPYTVGQYALLLKDIVSMDGAAIYFHCTQGKDRTGLCASFLLAALGASEDVICEEYALSAECYRPYTEYYARRLRSLGKGEREMEVVRTFISVNPAHFRLGLGFLAREYGSLSGFIREGLGLRQEDIDLLRTRYLE